MTQQELIAKTIPGISTDEINAHFGLLPDRYFIHTDSRRDRPAHLRWSTGCSSRSPPPTPSARCARDRMEGRPQPLPHRRQRRHLGPRRTLLQAGRRLQRRGLSILGAKVISRSDHIAIDTFFVVEPGRGVVQSAAAQETFARTIESALVANKDLYPRFMAQAKKRRQPLPSPRPAALHTSFPPTVEVYHELSMERTIVEIQARDQIGLLYRLAKTISDQGFDITFARIGTERGVAIDTFYIEPANHEPVSTPERLHELRVALNEVIAPAPIPAPAAAAK
jgi:[protein-PII] uridylyltransferase